MLGHYENFPETLHHKEAFTSFQSRIGLQQTLAQVLLEVNRVTFSFEKIAIPTVPNSTVMFEWGIADDGCFTSIGEEEEKRIREVTAKEPLQVMDFFCAIRYYKNVAGKKSPLKFDYYMVRVFFAENRRVEFHIFHERGPRYLSPADLVLFLVTKVNGTSTKRLLKSAETD